MRRTVTIPLLAVTLLTAGCASNPHHHGGQLVAEYHPGDEPKTTCAPYKATYVLYHWPAPPTDPAPHTWVPEKEVVELYVRGLGRHDTVGFEKNSDGELQAVAGEEKILLDDGRYCWHISSDTEYRGFARLFHETQENVVNVLELPFGIVILAVELPFLLLFLCFGGLCFLCM
jgi:hypothetical protein